MAQSFYSLQQYQSPESLGFTRTSTQGGGTLFSKDGSYYLQGTSGLTLTTDASIIPKTTTAAPTSDYTSPTPTYTAPAPTSGFQSYVIPTPDFYGRYTAVTGSGGQSSLYSTKEEAYKAIGADPNLNAIPGETYQEYQARLGQTQGGVGTGFGTPLPFSPSISTPSTISGADVTAPAPSLPEPTAPSTYEEYTTSMTASLSKARADLEASLKRQKEELDRTIADFSDKQAEFVKTNMNPLTSPFRETLENAERKRLYINENFEANQTLTKELETLLTEGNTLIAQQKAQTGLAAIRNPRIAKTMEDIAARTGVIEAVINARNGQITVAENMIDRSVTAISADRKDRISYYNALLKIKGDEFVALTKNEEDYLTSQVTILTADLNRLQANADAIKAAMQDPDTALLYAQAGVKINDSPTEVARKVAKAAYEKEVRDLSNKKAEDGYTYLAPGQVAPAGAQIITTTDSKGVTKQYYKVDKEAGGFTLSEGQTRYDAQGNVIATGKLAPSVAQEDRALDQLSFLRTTAGSALQLAGASGRSGARRTAEAWFVGSTDYTKLESLTNTLRTNVLTLMTDPDIKKFFGPQMSEADVRLMTAAGTTLNPELQGPEQMKQEITRLDDLLRRMQSAVAGGVAQGRIVIAPDGTEVEIID